MVDETAKFNGEPLRMRGRPAKPDAMTAAERAKRYRARQKEKNAELALAEAASRSDEINGLKARLYKVQMAYDLERVRVVNLQTQLENLKLQIKKPPINPLAEQVGALKRTIADQDKTIRQLFSELEKRRGESAK